MIIKRLRFKNLNSLAGEWEIDFSQPEYVSEGIFLIAGHTGVGKTTLLDAICLALYGQTPRLGKITKSENEIIRRQTAECFAEILFETPDDSYICHWSQRRARSKADGALQAPKHEVSIASTGKVLENMLSKTAPKVAELCGLDFDRFTRSIMLAQGDFAKFLQSTTGERSDILENITGSEIYTDLSKSVHDRKVSEDSKLKQITDQMDGIQTLSLEQISELETEYNLAKELSVSKKKERDSLQQALHWKETLGKEKALISRTQIELAEHAKTAEQAKPEQLALDLAKRAHEVEPSYREWHKAANEEVQLKKKIVDLTDRIQSQETNYKNQLQAHAQAKLAYQTQRELSKELEPKLIEAGKIFTKVEQETHYASSQRDAYKVIQKQAQSSANKISDTKNILQTLEKDHLVSQQYLESHSSHESLLTQLSGLKQIGKSWLVSLSEMAGITNNIQSSESTIAKITEQITQSKKALEEHALTLKTTTRNISESKQSQLNILKNRSEHDLEKELSNLRAQRILDLEHLEQFRESLNQEQPCPVCGSLEHPYKDQAPPSNSEIKLEILSLEKQLSKLTELTKAIVDLSLLKEKQKAKIEQAQQSVENYTGQLQEKKSILETQRNDLVNNEIKCQQLHQSLHTGIIQYSTTDLDPNSLNNIFSHLEKLAKEWERHAKSSQVYKEHVATHSTALKAENEALESLNLRLREIEDNGKKSVAQLAEFTTSLKALIGEANIEELKTKDEADLKKSEDFLSQQNSLREQQKTQLDNLLSQQNESNHSLAKLSDEISELAENVRVGLATHGFKDQQSYIEARMSSDQRQLLEQKMLNLKEREQQLQTRLSDAKTRFKVESDKNLSDLALDDLAAQIKLVSSEYESSSTTFGALQQRLTDHKNAVNSLQGKLQERAIQETECQRWTKLHNLIGSSDGKKFRNFAQGLTFEVMVRHANEQLSKMTDRYQLTRDNEQPLDLSVIDQYQAGEIRSTKNLSGGESFIISLSLALGLSKMASKNVQVDSLFLDEGFGTLDEEALETAIDTLASMNQEGKIIGIISHIAALKDRITTQIKLERAQNGSATISGPGIKKL